MEFTWQPPKNISQLRRAIVPITRDHPELADRLRELAGFDVRWYNMTLEQSWRVWWAWRALRGDARAARLLEAEHGIQVEEREKIDPAEVSRLRDIAARYARLEKMILAAHNPDWNGDDLEQALFQIIMERNALAQALRGRNEAEIRDARETTP